MKYHLTKTELYSILTGISTASLIISNILAYKTFTFYNLVLPCAVILFPVLYIISDILAEIYGFKKARKVIYLGFMMNLMAVIMFNIAINLPAPSYFEGAEAFRMVLSNSFRVLVASFISFISGSLVNAYVMVYLKEKLEKYLFIRCIGSTICGEGLDSLIFITIAFYATMPNDVLLFMIISQLTVKVSYEIICYPLTKLIINSIRKLPEI